MKILMGEHTHFDSLFQVGCHHLARGLAERGHEVTYLSTPLTPLHLANLFTSKRGETLKRFKNWMAGGRTQAPGLFSYVPFSFLPFLRLSPFDNSESAWNHLKFTFPPLKNRVRKKGPFDLFLMGDPRFVPLMKKAGAKKNILRLTDNVLGFESTPRSTRGLIQYAVNHCDKVIVTSRPLQKLLADQYEFKKALYIPNGVDLGHFLKSSAGEPEELRDIPKPRVVYVGALEKWFDLKLLTAAAETLPKVSFVLIGPPRINLSELDHFKNIYRIGPKPYSDIPSYLKACQVGIIPFQNNELINSVSPLKLYEYLACGLPVVASEWEELKLLRSPALLCRDSKGFIAGIRKALTQKPPVSRLKAFAAKQDWKVRVSLLLKAAKV